MRFSGKHFFMHLMKLPLEMTCVKKVLTQKSLYLSPFNALWTQASYFLTQVKENLGRKNKSSQEGKNTWLVQFMI